MGGYALMLQPNAADSAIIPIRAQADLSFLRNFFLARALWLCYATASRGADCAHDTQKFDSVGLICLVGLIYLVLLGVWAKLHDDLVFLRPIFIMCVVFWMAYIDKVFP